MYETVEQLPDNIQADCTPEEQAEYLRVFNNVFTQTNAADKAAAAAWGAVKKMRLVGVSVMKSAPNGDPEIGGWAMKFVARGSDDKDLYETYFSRATQLLLEYYQGAPLWMEHGQDTDYGPMPIGRRSLVEIYGHGVWMGHGVHRNHVRYAETKRDIDNGEFSYSSDSIGHYVDEGFNPVDGRMGLWPFAGCSLTRSPAEPSLGPALPTFRAFYTALKSATEQRKQQTESEAREARRSGERKTFFFVSDKRGVKSIMSPEQLAALAQFLGVEATPEAVAAALQQLISQLTTAPAADAPPAEAQAQTEMMSAIGGALGMPATAGRSEILAKLGELSAMVAAPPSKKLNYKALKAFAGLVDAALEEPEDDIIPYLGGDDPEDEDEDDEPATNRSTYRMSAQRSARRDRQVSFQHNRRSKKPGLLDVIGAISQVQNGPITFEMPSFKSQRTSAVKAMKAMNINSGPNGGWWVDREMSNELLEALYAREIFEQLGVTNIPMSGIESVTMNRVGSGATAYWVGAEQTVPDSGQVPLQAAVTLNLKELVCEYPIQNRLLQNSSMQLEAMIERDILKVMRLKRELSFLYGSGGVPAGAGNSGAEPLGLYNITGITKTPLGNKAPSFDNLIEAEGRIEDSNYDYERLGWVSHNRTRRLFKKMKDANGDPIFMESYRDGGIREMELMGYDFLTTTQIPITSNQADMFLGDWSAMLIGQGQDLEIFMDTSVLIRKRQTLIQVVTLVDSGVAYKEAFQILTGAKV